MSNFVGVQAHISGPLIDGRARLAAKRLTEEAVDEVALQYGINVVAELQRVVKHPTPYYWTQIQVDKVGAERVVNDSGVIYGPWLAGVGSRNKTSRFKGYQHWRLASQRMRRRTPQILVRLLNKYVPRMGG